MNSRLPSSFWAMVTGGSFSIKDFPEYPAYLFIIYQGKVIRLFAR